MKKNLPKARLDSCHFRSIVTTDYNCVGFVVGDYRWWQPEERDEYYWPNGVARNYWARTYIEAMATVQFEVYRTRFLFVEPQYDPAFETVAIFHKGGLFKHAALQVNSGVWKSKLGDYEDLEHPLSAMKKGMYGMPFGLHISPRRSAR